MRRIGYYSKQGKLPLILLPLILISVFIAISFFAVIGLISFFVIGVIGLAVSLFKSMKSGKSNSIDNYDSQSNTITLEKKDYEIEQN